MRTVSSKVDNTIHEKVVSRCNGLGCSPSQYIKDLIERDLNGESAQPATEKKPTPVGRLVDLDKEKPTIVKGTLRWAKPDEVGKAPKARAIHHLGNDGKPLWTDHYDENGKFQYRQYYDTQ